MELESYEPQALLALIKWYAIKFFHQLMAVQSLSVYYYSLYDKTKITLPVTLFMTLKYNTNSPNHASPGQVEATNSLIERTLGWIRWQNLRSCWLSRAWVGLTSARTRYKPTTKSECTDKHPIAQAEKLSARRPWPTSLHTHPVFGSMLSWVGIIAQT